MSSPTWNMKRVSKDKLLEHLEGTRLIDELDWAGTAGSLEDTLRAVSGHMLRPLHASPWARTYRGLNVLVE